jgi:hypothetical protein
MGSTCSSVTSSTTLYNMTGLYLGIFVHIPAILFIAFSLLCLSLVLYDARKQMTTRAVKSNIFKYYW